MGARYGQKLGKSHGMHTDALRHAAGDNRLFVKLFKVVLQRFFLFQLTNDLCTSFTKNVIILFF